PLDAMEWNTALVKSPDGDPTHSPAGQAIAGALARDKSAAGSKARGIDGLKTITRLNAIPPAQRTLANPKFAQFLLYHNQGNIRAPSLGIMPDPQHAQMITRLAGNQSIVDEGTTADFIQKTANSGLSFANSTIVSTGAPELLKNVNDYLTGGMATLALI